MSRASWRCKNDEHINRGDALVCEICGAKRPTIDSSKQVEKKEKNISSYSESPEVSKNLSITKVLFLIVGVISAYFLIDFLVSQNSSVVQSNLPNKPIIDQSTEQKNVVNSKPKIAITSNYAHLHPDLSSEPVYFVYPNSTFEIVDRRENFIQISTQKGLMWAEKENFKIVDDSKNISLNNTNQKIEKVIWKVGTVVIDDITISKEPSVFSETEFKLDAGDKVFVFRKAPDTIYLLIRSKGRDYYIMDNAVKFDK